MTFPQCLFDELVRKTFQENIFIFIYLILILGTNTELHLLLLAINNNKNYYLWWIIIEIWQGNLQNSEKSALCSIAILKSTNDFLMSF